jgi:hypothetical protein
MPLLLAVVGLGELVWSTWWIFYLALGPSALFYAVGQAREASRTAQRPSDTSIEPPVDSAAVRPTPVQHAFSVIARLILFTVVGIAGWTFGSLAGLVVGIGLDLVFLADQPSGAGATVVSTVWGTSLIGATIGLVGAVMWLATRIGPG